MRETKEYVLPPSQVPRMFDNWVITEVVTSDNEMNDLCSDSVHVFLNDENTYFVIDDEIPKKRYPLQNEANLERVFKLLAGAFVRFEFMRLRKMCVNNTNNVVHVLSSMVVPSVKSSVKNAIGDDLDKQMEGYTCYIAFGKVSGETTLKYLPYPFSCCGCYDGRHICSHLLASLGAIFIPQIFTEEQSKIILNMTSPIDVQNIATPIELCK